MVIRRKRTTSGTRPARSYVFPARPLLVNNGIVNRPDFHSVLPPRMKQGDELHSEHKAVIRNDECICCGVCLRYCSFGAIKMDRKPKASECFSVDPVACNGCGFCVPSCPVDAIELVECTCGA